MVRHQQELFIATPAVVCGIEGVCVTERQTHTLVRTIHRCQALDRLEEDTVVICGKSDVDDGGPVVCGIVPLAVFKGDIGLWGERVDAGVGVVGPVHGRESHLAHGRCDSVRGCISCRLLAWGSSLSLVAPGPGLRSGEGGTGEEGQLGHEYKKCHGDVGAGALCTYT